MARRYFSSNAQRTTLTSSVTNVATSFVVGAVTGFPVSYPYTLIIDPDTVNEEVVSVSAGAGTTLTVTRGVGGTTAVAHSAGAVVMHGVYSADFDEPNAHINAASGVHGVTGAVVGTTDTQTLTNKTISQSQITNLTTDLAAKPTYFRQSSAPTGAFNTLWEDTSTSPSTVKIWNGSAWVSFNGARFATVSGTTGSPTTGTYSDADGNWTYYKWTGNGSVTFSAAGYVDVLVLGGGAGGQEMVSNGQGGRSVRGIHSMTAATHTVTVGAGGAGGGGGVGGESVLGPLATGFAIAAGGAIGVTAFTSSITGSAVTYATQAVDAAPTANTGNGGSSGSSRAGASGVVIIRVKS